MIMRIHSIAALVMLILIAPSTGWSADFEKGQEAYNIGDYQTALTEWQPLAEEGHADAQFSLGLLYASGFGVALNDNLALKWYRSAADQGHAEAQCNIAVMYANGWGVSQNDEEAFGWYKLAANGGVTRAQMSLAKMYSSGFGTEKNSVEALKWFTIASDLGDYGASSKRDDLAARISADEVSEANRLANVWMDSHQGLLANE